MDIILASTSPRRQEYLRQVGVTFRTIPSHADEDFEPGTPPAEVVRMLAEKKARVVGDENPTSLVIAADTVVAIENEILVKPTDAADASSMLRQLSGKTHQVYTGYCLIREGKVQDAGVVKTDVTFGDLSDELIERYVATGEPLDKAGAYGIQGAGAILVKSLNGSFFNVAGMPLYEIAGAIARLGGLPCVLKTT